MKHRRISRGACLTYAPFVTQRYTYQDGVMKVFHNCKSSSDLTFLRVLKEVVHGFVIFYLKMRDLILYKSEHCSVRRPTSLSLGCPYPSVMPKPDFRSPWPYYRCTNRIPGSRVWAEEESAVWWAGTSKHGSSRIACNPDPPRGSASCQDEKCSQVGHALPETALGNVEKDGLVTAATLN